MPKSQENDPFGYMGTGTIAYFVAWCFEASAIQFCRVRMGFRFNSPRKAFYGLIAGLGCVLLQEAPGGTHLRGVSPLFLFVYLVAAAMQQAAQNRRFHTGEEIHSHSSGWPVVGRLLPGASIQTLYAVEALGLLGLAVFAEALRLPLSLWLGLSAVFLVVRGQMDAYAQRLADADAIDAHLHAEEMSRTLRRRRGGS